MFLFFCSNHLKQIKDIREGFLNSLFGIWTLASTDGWYRFLNLDINRFQFSAFGWYLNDIEDAGVRQKCKKHQQKHQTTVWELYYSVFILNVANLLLWILFFGHQNSCCLHIERSQWALAVSNVNGMLRKVFGKLLPRLSIRVATAPKLSGNSVFATWWSVIVVELCLESWQVWTPI